MTQAVKKGWIAVPIDHIKWKTIDNFPLCTPLGSEEVTAQVVDGSGKYTVLKPGEELRIRKLQAFSFCEGLKTTNAVITAAQLRYLSTLFGMSLSDLYYYQMKGMQHSWEKYMKGMQEFTDLHELFTIACFFLDLE